LHRAANAIKAPAHTYRSASAFLLVSETWTISAYNLGIKVDARAVSGTGISLYLNCMVVQDHRDGFKICPCLFIYKQLTLNTMKKLLLSILSILCLLAAHAQTAQQYFDKGNEYFELKDYDNAITYFKMANDMCGGNEPVCLCSIGSSYYLKDNYSQAAYWYRKAAEQGNANAQHNLGNCYYYGKGVEQDYTQAVYLYRKAAEQGNSDAQNALGYCYYNGEGVERDYSQAVYWFRKAAEQGHGEAQYFLGRCYEKGKGVEQNDSLANYWYKKAEESGYTNLGEALFNELFGDYLFF